MKKSITLISFLLCFLCSHANNVNLSNIQVVNNGPDSTYVQFDLSWDNSWRVANGPGNYDGVWIFFKFKTQSYIGWPHLPLSPYPTCDFFPEGLECWKDSSNLGAIFYRSASNKGTGTVSFSGIRLTLSPALPFNMDIQGFAIEMVFIPSQEHPLVGLPIIVGDGDGTEESTNAFHRSDIDNFAAFSYYPISVDPNGFDDSTIETPFSFSIGGPGENGIASVFGNYPYFPTGSDMWCMKYEITQGAYRDFLNTLFLAQQSTRTANAPTSAIGTGALITSGTGRNYLEIETPSANGQPAVYGCDANGNNVFDEPGDGEYIACNYLSWQDVAAWLTWAGLCPMTEIQFERICRGVSFGGIQTVLGEYAWGDTSLITSSLNLINAFASNELISNASTSVGNANYLDVNAGGPLRNGIFATPSSSRVTSGSTFFGVMDMSGNLFEPCVTVGNVIGRSFSKSAENGWYGSARGQGYVNSNGNAQVFRWPGCSTDPNTEADEDCIVINANGTILRGGAWDLNKTYMKVSDRSAGEAFTIRTSFQGGRGVIVPAMYGE